MFLDVTKAVSSSLAGDLPNKGFRISFSGSDETDSKTRFVKRFISKQSKNKRLSPRILVTWDDSMTDRHLDLRFGESSTLFLKNNVSGVPTNLIKNVNGDPVVGLNSLKLRLVSGSGTKNETTFEVQASQLTGSTTGEGTTGVYLGTFTLSEFNTSFFGDTPKTRGEVELQEIWSSNDLTVPYYSGSVIIKKPTRSTAGFSSRRLHVTAHGAQPEYISDSDVSIRIFVEDLDTAASEKAYKLPRKKKSLVLGSCFYRIVDKESGDVIVPFDKVRNSTKVSTDADGLFVSFKTSALPKGRIYGIELLLNDLGIERLVKLEDVAFRVI